MRYYFGVARRAGRIFRYGGMVAAVLSALAILYLIPYSTALNSAGQSVPAMLASSALLILAYFGEIYRTVDAVCADRMGALLPMDRRTAFYGALASLGWSLVLYVLVGLGIAVGAVILDSQSSLSIFSDLWVHRLTIFRMLPLLLLELLQLITLVFLVRLLHRFFQQRAGRAQGMNKLFGTLTEVFAVLMLWIGFLVLAGFVKQAFPAMLDWNSYQLFWDHEHALLATGIPPTAFYMDGQSSFGRYWALGIVGLQLVFLVVQWGLSITLLEDVLDEEVM